MCEWAGVLYLNRDHQGEPGTCFYEHIQTGALRFGGEHSKDWPFIRDSENLAKWELRETVNIRFNRLVLYDATQFHRNASTWGTQLADSRLVQGFFFSTTVPEE
jgi:hypothetical protein